MKRSDTILNDVAPIAIFAVIITGLYKIGTASSSIVESAVNGDPTMVVGGVILLAALKFFLERIQSGVVANLMMIAVFLVGMKALFL